MEERAEEGRAKVFEGPEYTSSFCHARRASGGRGAFTVNLVHTCLRTWLHGIRITDYIFLFFLFFDQALCNSRL